MFGRTIFVRVFTDEGIVGLGECGPMRLGAIVHFVNEILTPLCVGKNPLEIDRLWSAMDYDLYTRGETGLHLEAMAGVDIIQPDIVTCDGFTEIRKIAAPGETHHTRMVPHQTMPSVRTAANSHVIASLRDAHRPQERTRIDKQLNSLFKEPLMFETAAWWSRGRPGWAWSWTRRRSRGPAMARRRRGAREAATRPRP
jgi:L-alanine-DL-glutamate epimerase-like enolase superfamily enzyme